MKFSMQSLRNGGWGPGDVLQLIIDKMASYKMILQELSISPTCHNSHTFSHMNFSKSTLIFFSLEHTTTQQIEPVSSITVPSREYHRESFL